MTSDDPTRAGTLSPRRDAPPWVDRDEYPFRPRYFQTPRGRISFVDEGEGPPVVMVHGNPAWSFLYRNMIKDLTPGHRAIAPDHLGFGLSDKPTDVEYTPRLHADNLAALLDALELDDVTLVVHDWGGPVGLSYARLHPQRVRRVVLFNTWAWPVRGDLYYWGFSRFMGGPVGRLLIRRFNFFVKGVMKMARGDESAWNDLVVEHYRRPQATPDDRRASMALPGQILDATPFLEELWSSRESFADLPFLVLWGGADIAFRDKELKVWRRELKNATVRVMPEAGHYVQEERHAEFMPAVREFLAG